MSATAYISGPSSLTRLRKLEKGAAFHPQKASFRGGLRQFPIDLFLRSSSYGWRRSSTSKSIRRFSPVMEWQDCRANLHILDEPLPKNASRLFLQELEPYGDMTCINFSEIEVAVPCSVAYQCYSDRETIPEWMPFISSVKVLQDKPDLSRWSLKYEVFGRNVEFSWLARNMQPIPNQKIHWRSLEGLPNRGAVRFFPKGPSACRVQLTVSYEVPEILSPVASALKPFLEGLLANGLERFATVARDYQRKIPQR